MNPISIATLPRAPNASIAGALALSRDETDQILSMHARLNPDNTEALKLAISTLLRRKGRALDAMSGTISTLRQRADSQDQALFNQLSTAGTKLASLTLRGPVNNQFAEYRVRLQELTDEVDKAEASLSARSAEFRTTTQPISLETIQAAIPEGAALLEFAVYRPYDVKTRRFGPARYVVYTLSAKGEPRWADLGEAATIDRNVAALRLALRNPQRTDVKRLARDSRRAGYASRARDARIDAPPADLAGWIAQSHPFRRARQ